jgi:hypothetical protein
MTKSAYNAHSNPLSNPLSYGTWSAVHNMAGGPASHPLEDNINESKKDSGGCLHSCHAV